jgi:hypothetical protein
VILNRKSSCFGAVNSDKLYIHDSRTYPHPLPKINSLPAELLAQIFQYSVDTSVIHAEDLLVICKYWYQVILESSGLWNHINLYNRAVRRYRTPIAYVRMYIRHSRSHSLKVRIRLDSWESDSVAICQALAPTIHRWTEADISIIGEDYYQAGFRYLRTPAPALRTLRISIFSSFKEKLDLTCLFLDTRSLINLRIERAAAFVPAITLPAAYRSTIKHLELERFQGASALPIIYQLPRIVHLCLIEYTTVRDTPSKPVLLPSLTTLVFIPIQSGELRRFLDQVSMPRLREVYLSKLFADNQANEAVLSGLTAEGCTIVIDE